MSAPQSQARSPALAPASAAVPASPVEVLHLVDFKWLMAGEGHRIDLARLQSDRAYARGCLALAGSSTCTTLRGAAERLREGLPILHDRS